MKSAVLPQEGPPFSSPSPIFVICKLLNDGHFDWFEVILHCRLDLHFSKN